MSRSTQEKYCYSQSARVMVMMYCCTTPSASCARKKIVFKYTSHTSPEIMKGCRRFLNAKRAFYGDFVRLERFQFMVRELPAHAISSSGNRGFSF